MNVDITKLRSGIVDEIPILEVKSFTKEELSETGILELNEVKIEGNITKNSIDAYWLEVVITGDMVLPCSVTLKPVLYPISIPISGNIEQMLEEMGEIDKKIENTIDIFPIIWENILVEIPSRVVSEDAKNLTLKGEGWSLCTEERNEEINPELQKLRDLLK